MNKNDTLIIESSQTNFEEIEFIRKDAIIEWTKYRMSFEQGFQTGEAERGYKFALEDLINEVNKL